MVASNTRDCFRICIGKRVTGVLFDAFPVGKPDLSPGTKTLIFEDGSGLTVSDTGTFWIENPEEVRRAIEVRQLELNAIKSEISEVLAAAGALP